jgi:two-component system KDP operon response regulator KdpE
MAACILLVDDDPQIVRAIVPALEVSGLAVTIATNGADALQHVDCGQWDALIVDLGLPDIDGKAVVRHSRSRSAAPVIVISAQHSAGEVASAHEAGACCFLHKPFRTPELVRRVEESIAAAKDRA